MKKILFTVASCLLFHGVNHAQDNMQLKEITLVGGKNFSSFIFKDSGGSKDKTLDYVMYNSFGANLSFTKRNHTIRPELLFRQAGAKSDFEGTSLSWKMNYLDLNVAYLYSVLNTRKFAISPGVGIGAGYMLNGEQHIGEVRYSVSETQALKRFDFGFHGLANFKAYLNDAFTISLEYRFGMGITQIENDVNAQMSRNLYHSALLGFGILLNQKKSSRFN
ncbi:hypothetical protein GCM10009118_16910 [Wandonia haliotis]|uniref:Outer membrane protein beta-barrel domain-containing protein n=1 Tax=Wandonia haliotis TaxID=574963 RepID=A0ABP3Y6R5_9FLAO